jgi:hypothetical protein
MSALAKRLLAIALAGAFNSEAGALDINQDPKPHDCFFAAGMGCPAQAREKLFRADVKRANFTLFDGVENVAVRDGKLGFTLAGPRATLGWGNYMGRQRPAEIEDMGQQTAAVRIKAKQSPGKSKWTLRLWRDGQRLEETRSAALEGPEWREIGFEPLRSGGANPDGLELTVEGDKGTHIELEWLKLAQPVFEGCCRTEFVLPEGRIWRAVADVGSANDRNWYGVDQMSSRLYLNGKVVERKAALHLYHTRPVDIAPYLKPGRNCVGFYGFRIGYQPFLFFQATIVMESGEVVKVASGPQWKCNPRAPQGWNEVGFDDSSWTAVGGGSAPWPAVRDAAMQLCLPAYGGRLVIKNPSRRDLFFSEAGDVAVDVCIPPGLKDRRPTLSYLFGRADADGKCTLVKEGSVASFAGSGNSLVFRVNLGRHGRGVYALALSLKAADGTVIEERSREPLVVLRQQRPKPVEAKDFTEGLDLEPEDEIDFTNPSDPHPWVEGKLPEPLFNRPTIRIEKPVVIRQGGLVYREVFDPRRGSGFSYRLQFKHPGSFYCLELEYPDDAKRIIEVSISSKTQGIFLNSQSGVGAETGGRFLPTGKMEKLQWIHVADPGPHSVDVFNVVDGEKAAAKSLKIYRIRGDLPSAGGGTSRWYGIHTERCFFTSGIGINFGVGTPRNNAELEQQDKTFPPMRGFLKDLVWMAETGDRYVQYLRFAGQNCHVMGCIQYDEYNTPFVARALDDDSRILHCMKTMMANLFEVNRINFLAGVEFSQSMDLRTYANNAQVARGADTLWMVNAKGEQVYGHGLCTVVPNWLHPDVRRRYNRLMEDLCDTFGHLSRFRGVHGLLGPCQREGYWIPAFGLAGQYENPLNLSFDDTAMALFEKESGIELPVAKSDPRRFEKRAAILESPGFRQRLLAWRCEKLKDFFAEAVRTLKGRRNDLQLVNVLAVEESGFFQHLARSGKTFDQVMKRFAIDLDRLNTVDGLRTGRWTISWRQTAGKFPTQDPYCWLSRTSPDIVSTFKGPSNRYVLVRTSWDENLFMPGRYAIKDDNDRDHLVESDWIMNAQRVEGLPQPAGYHCREGFLDGLVTSDPGLLLGGFTDMGINLGHEQPLRSILATYTRLPRERFTPVLETGLRTNLAIRQLTQAGQSYFYVANPCQWPIRGSLTLRTDGEIVELAGGRPVQTAASGDARELRLSLSPFGLAAYRVTSPRLAISGYRTEPLAAEELSRIGGVVDRVGGLLADPGTRLSLSLADRKFMAQTLDSVRKAIAEQQYALAWALITDYRFWNLWKDFLEKARCGGDGKRPGPQITYDASRNCLSVIGFPEEEPATMAAILDADRKHGWGKVAYDRATDTYRVDADLWIGDEEGGGTFVQIGDREHPEVTVVVKGTVWVRPPKESPLRSDGLASVINRLTLGDPESPKIRATLAIACDSPGQHGLYIGYNPPRIKSSAEVRQRGSLHVYHGTITAATQDPKHVWGGRDYTGEKSNPRWGAPGWYASDVRLKGATISWFEGCVTYGMQTGKRAFREPVEWTRPNPLMSVEDTRFEHGGSAVSNGEQCLVRCAFRNMETAVAEGGCLAAKLTNCVFEGNRANWTLGSLQSGGIVLVDCKIGPPKDPIAISKNRITLEQATHQHLPVYPACLERQSLRVQVLDRAGRPVPEAIVTVSCKSDPEAVGRGAALTDSTGLTPGDFESGAILVTTRKYQATDDPNHPQETTFAYEVAAAKAGFQPAVVELPLGGPIRTPLVVTLDVQPSPRGSTNGGR